MTQFLDAKLEALVTQQQRSWLVTGCAGFIGSHLTEQLLRLGQRVVGLDNFATGHRQKWLKLHCTCGFFSDQVAPTPSIVPAVPLFPRIDNCIYSLYLQKSFVDLSLRWQHVLCKLAGRVASHAFPPSPAPVLVRK